MGATVQNQTRVQHPGLDSVTCNLDSKPGTLGTVSRTYAGCPVNFLGDCLGRRFHPGRAVAQTYYAGDRRSEGCLGRTSHRRLRFSYDAAGYSWAALELRVFVFCPLSFPLSTK